MNSTKPASILNFCLIVCVMTIGSLALTRSASAQSGTVNIPFAFHTPTQTLPAGIYQIDRGPAHLVLLRGSHVAEFAEPWNVMKSHATNYGTVVFDRVGDKYYLRQIWTAGDNVGLEFPKSRDEKMSLQAKNKQALSSTVLAFNSPKN